MRRVVAVAARASVRGPEAIASTLRASLPFSRAGRATREALVAEARYDEFARGAALFRPGDARKTIDVLARGRARIERPTDADPRATIPIAYRGAHDLLDDDVFGAAGSHDAIAVALEPGALVRVPIAAFREAEAGDAALAFAVMALLVARRRELEDRVESLLFRSVEGRVAEFLVRIAAQFGVPSPRGALISMPLTHLEIARAIGSTRETVTVTIGALRREGLLDVAGRRLIVCDATALAARG